MDLKTATANEHVESEGEEMATSAKSTRDQADCLDSLSLAILGSSLIESLGFDDLHREGESSYSSWLIQCCKGNLQVVTQ